MISRKVRFELNFERDVAGSMKETATLIKRNKGNYFLAVVDLNLPDARDGEVVDLVQSHGIPVIVFTGQFSDEIRESMLAKNVVDYVLKEGGPQVVDYLADSIERFYKNRNALILVVDDSSTSRTAMCQLLKSRYFNVLEASDGRKALELLQKNPETKVVITDYNMPGMDGAELVTRIRQTHDKSKVAIIGVSGYGTGLLSARFLKAGASDFLSKPYLEEEFYCRLNQNIEMLEFIEKIEKSANVDHLTGIYNRRYFLQMGQKLVENARRGNIQLTIAMVDIDHFSALNHQHGFETGDLVLIEIAQILMRNFRAADILSRFGGQQFCIAAVNMSHDSTAIVFERIRRQVARKKIRFGEMELAVTISIGATVKMGENIEDMLQNAGALLQKAKLQGRNRIRLDIEQSAAIEDK